MILLFLILHSSAFAIDFMGLRACSKQYGSLAKLDDSLFSNYPAALALKKALDQDVFEGKPNSNLIVPVGGKFRLVIKEFSRDSKKLNALMLRAVREGGISEIDAGSVVGPKVITLLKRFEGEFLESGQEVVIKGRWIPFLIKREFQSQQVAPGNKSQYFWAPKEKEDFLAAAERYGVFDCHKKLGLPEVSPCEFRLNIKGGKSHFEYIDEN